MKWFLQMWKIVHHHKTQRSRNAISWDLARNIRTLAYTL
jgi:hypothetical protein